jgi:hypothetical protein
MEGAPRRHGGPPIESKHPEKNSLPMNPPSEIPFGSQASNKSTNRDTIF